MAGECVSGKRPRHYYLSVIMIISSGCQLVLATEDDAENQALCDMGDYLINSNHLTPDFLKLVPPPAD